MLLMKMRYLKTQINFEVIPNLGTQAGHIETMALTFNKAQIIQAQIIISDGQILAIGQDIHYKQIHRVYIP